MKLPAFSSCLDSNKYAAEVERDKADGERAGVTSTPTFFVNGKRFLGRQTFADFQQKIDEELAEKAAQAGVGP